jgi:protein subunit release factor A
MKDTNINDKETLDFVRDEEKKTGE